MLDEYKMQSIRNEIKRHKLTISLTTYKIEILNMQLELTDYEDVEEGFFKIQFDKFVKYNNRLQTCKEQIRKLKRGLKYQMSLRNNN